jgi:hypothetical protein
LFRIFKNFFVKIDEITKILQPGISVAEDPDLAFQVNPDPDPGSESRGLMTKKTEEKNFSFLIKYAIYLSLGLHKGRPSYKRGLQPSKENIQHFKNEIY